MIPLRDSMGNESVSRKSRRQYPIIISAPHAVSVISDRSIRRRILLSDEELYEMSDPFTADLRDFTCAIKKHIAPNHRILCDQNRAPTHHGAFRTVDFKGRRIFRKGKAFTEAEKSEFLQQYWHPYHERITRSVKWLDEEGAEVILFIDYHNTTNSYPITQELDYMPSFVLSNMGTRELGKRSKKHPQISIPSQYLRILKREIMHRLPLTVELNVVYRGGYNMQWIHELRRTLKPRAKLYGIQVEYNLGFVRNILSGKVDRKALHIMQRGLNEAFRVMYERIIKIESFQKSRKHR